MKTSVRSIIERFSTRGNRRAVGLRDTFGAWWWSYGTLHANVEQVASLLEAWGVRSGDRVLLMAPNSPEWVAAALGTLLTGAVVVPVDEGATPAFVNRLVDEAKPAVLLYSTSNPLDERAPVISRPMAECFQTTGAPIGSRDRVPISEDDPAVILYTSGTTRVPRGVVLTHRNLLTQVEAFGGWHPMTQSVPVRLLVLSPLSHVQGLLIGLFVPMSLGLSVLFSRSVEPTHVIRTIRDDRVNVLLAVPHVQHLLARTVRASPYRNSSRTIDERLHGVGSFALRRHLLFLGVHGTLGYSLWVLLVGGARLAAADERFWFESGLVCVNGYGLTETSALVSLQINGPFSWRPGSIGRPLSHSDVRLAADGELLVRGRTVAPELLGAGDENAGSGEGYLATGDLARPAGRRRYIFLGRKTDVIVTSNGMNVHPSDVEAVLTSLAGVRDAVVVEALDGSTSGIHAVLLLDDRVDSAATVSQANLQLEPHQRISQWSTWPEPDFPRSTLAKVRRAEVAERVALRVAASATAPPSTDDTPTAARPLLSEIRRVGDRRRRIELIRDHLLRGEPSEEDAETTLLEDLGLSSLDTIELLASLEPHQPLALREVMLTPGDSLADVRDKMAARRDQLSAHRPARPPRMDRVWFRVAQRILAPVVLGPWTSSVARVETIGREHLDGITAPIIVAVGHHEHGCDVLLVRQALPRRLRRQLLVVTTRWLFQEYLDNTDAPTHLRRTVVAGAFHIGLPMILPFALWPARHFAISGLAETGRLIGRGYSPVVFPETSQRLRVDPGVGLIAEQTKAVVVPMWLEGNDGMTLRPTRPRRRVVVHIGAPIRPAVGEDAVSITERVGQGLGAIASVDAP